MLKLESKADLESLITEGERESLTLEFKAGAALANEKKGEIGKDVSAMANAAGGQIVYGIKEKGHVAAEIQPVDVRKFNHEWLEKVIRNNISPAVDAVTIKMIEVGPGTSDVAFVVTIPPATTLAPHQAKVDLKYYRRHNFMADPMADYEIREAMRRAVAPDLVADIKFSIENVVSSFRLRVLPTLINRSTAPAPYAALTIFADRRLAPTVEASSPFNHDTSITPAHPYPFDLWAMTAEIGPPKHFPIFRERRAVLHRSSWDYPGDLNGQHFGMGYRVTTPGCEREEYFVLRGRNYQIDKIEKAI